MTRKLKNYQGGFSLIGIWPWTGVYAGGTLILSSYTGLFGAFIVTSSVFGLLAYLVEKAFPELDGLSTFVEELKPTAPEASLKSSQKYLTN